MSRSPLALTDAEEGGVPPRRRVRHALAARQHSLVNEIASSLPPHQRFRFQLRVQRLLASAPISDTTLDLAIDQALIDVGGEAA
jgi:hypothetical protein